MNEQFNTLKITLLSVCFLAAISCKKEAGLLNPNQVEKWTYYNTSNGMLSNQVNCLAEDNLHNIWIGTNKGLLKFDGNKFTDYSTKIVLPSDTINSIFWCRNNVLLIGTQKSIGRLALNGTYFNDIEEPNLKCLKFCEFGEENTIYCATNIGFFVYHFSENRIGYGIIDSTNINGAFIPDPVYDISYSTKNYLWLAAKKGVYVIRSSQIVAFSNIDLGMHDVSKLFSDKSGNVWIASSNDPKVMYYTGSGFVDDKIIDGNHNYKSFAQDIFNNYWISIDGLGVLNYGGRMSKLYNTMNSNITSNHINDILYDSKGNIWFGSNDMGLIYFQNIKPLQYDFDAGRNTTPVGNPIN